MTMTDMDDNWLYFGGTVEELTQAFSDLSIPQHVVFTHVCPHQDPTHFGFDYFTSFPGMDQVSPMDNPMTREEMITFLAGSITKMTISPDKVQFERDTQRLVWDLRSITDSRAGTLLTTKLVSPPKDMRYTAYPKNVSVLKH